jgi:hypothetical protein
MPVSSNLPYAGFLFRSAAQAFLKRKAWMAVSSTAITGWAEWVIGHDGWYKSPRPKAAQWRKLRS